MRNIDLNQRAAFTIFTATYNRAPLLHRAYKSLQAQTLRDFEWIVGDDGSTDETAELIKKWQRESDFTIRYFFQEHAGKNFVFNRGVREASGEYFAELASDDALKPDALERAALNWKKISEPDRKHYFAIMFSCEDETGRIVGPLFDETPCDYDFRSFNYSRKYRSEKWQCFRTEVLAMYPFREDVPKDCHIFESTVFCEIAKKYKARFVNDVARIYFLDGPSLTRGPKHPMKNLEGLRLSICYTLNNDLDFFFRRPIHFLQKSMNFARFSMHYGLSPAEQISSLMTFPARLLWLLTFLAAIAAFGFDIMRGRTPEAAERAEQPQIHNPAKPAT